MKDHWYRPTLPQIKRMRELRAAGLSARSVAIVIELDYGDRPSEHTVAKYAPAPPDHPWKRSRNEAGLWVS